MLQDLDAAEDQEILEDPDTAEDQEILKDPDAAEGFEETAKDKDHMVLMMDDSQHTINASMAQHTSSMSVNVSNQKTVRQHTKGKGNTKVKMEVKAEVKTEVKAKVEAPENIHSKIRKGKAKNSNLPSGIVQNRLWHMTFLPCLMFWVGNSNYRWSILEDTLERVLEDIYNAASQCIHEWWAAFSSTAIGILMAFFASTLEYETQEACKEYAEYQLQDCRFMYKDPNNEEQPGAFLSKYMLCIFATHLTAISGKVRVDALTKFVQPGYATALALSAVSAECALVLVQNCLLVNTNPSDNGGKTHKIIQMLNEATNKMSHTGTAFSSGNWETDTMVYMESIKDLPHERIQEILTQAEGYMKHMCPHHHTSNTGDEPSSSTAVALLLAYYTLFPSPLNLLSNLDAMHHPA
ncbi:hypothetical protein F4604DRAFT_1921955 [Suillus subluteus]|nr:hypothetical protein F4604DRAFT_1921955 [Suillus subluteus]